MFSRLSDKLQDVFKDLRGHGRIGESNINDALREVRLALLEADVHFKVAKDFVARVKEKSWVKRFCVALPPASKSSKFFKMN